MWFSGVQRLLNPNQMGPFQALPRCSKEAASALVQMGLLGAQTGRRRRRRRRAPAAPALLALALLLLLLLLPASCAPSPAEASATPADDDDDALPSLPGSRARDRLARARGERPGRAGAMEAIPPSNYPATRAAGVVENYINFQHGSPSRSFGVRKNIPGVGNKYHLKFSIKEFPQKGSPVNCTAEVLYHHGDPHVAPEVHYTVEEEFGTNTEQADNEFYNRMKNLSEPLEAQNIPDSYGNVPTEMVPIRCLGWVASSYINWQNSTEGTLFNTAQIASVKQVKRKDDYLEFSFVVLIHDVVSEEIIPWHMQVLWHPKHGTKVTQNSRQPKRVPQD